MPQPSDPSPTLSHALTTALLEKHHIPISQTYLSSHILPPNRSTPPPPLPALLSTALFRILTSDITLSLSTAELGTLLPEDIGDVGVKERRLSDDRESSNGRLSRGVIVQVLDVIDVGTSKWSQVEGIERVERGEEIRGREVIRSVPGTDTGDSVDDDDNEGGRAGHSTTNARANGTASVTTSSGGGTTSTKRSQGPHKLILQDAAKTIVTAFELVPIPGVFIVNTALPNTSASPAAAHQNAAPIEGIQIGTKILLKPSTIIRRGMILLTPETTVMLGGRVEIWDLKWRQNRKGLLIEDVERQQTENRG